MEFFTYITDIFQNFINVCRSITVFDVIDVLLLTYLIYTLFKLMRETRAEQLMKGIGVLVLVFVVVQICQLKVMSYLLENFFQVGILAIVVVFQPELRRMLEKVGRGAKVSNMLFEQADDNTEKRARDRAITGIAEACERLHLTKTGAIIVIERATKLGDIIEKSIVVNAEPDPELFCNLFFNKAPLHDGAVIIRGNRIYAAGCFLPNTSKDQYLSSSLGSRHRAAVGMSENSDALVIVVSEETGTISIAENGSLQRDISKETLIKRLKDKMPEQAVSSKKKKKNTKAAEQAPTDTK